LITTLVGKTLINILIMVFSNKIKKESIEVSCKLQIFA